MLPDCKITFRGQPGQEKKENSSKTCLIVPRFLDIVPPYHRRISVIIIASIGREINFSKQLLLMILQFSDHFASIRVLSLKRRVWRGGQINFWRSRIGKKFLRR
jgi:hypothetical protein